MFSALTVNIQCKLQLLVKAAASLDQMVLFPTVNAKVRINFGPGGKQISPVLSDGGKLKPERLTLFLIAR